MLDEPTSFWLKLVSAASLGQDGTYRACPQSPRPRHVNADDAVQSEFKKTR